MAVQVPLAVNPSAPHTHTHTVVFLHGRGSNARNFADSLSFSLDSRSRTLAEALPSFRWVFPQAPLRRCASSPDTIRQWFDVWNVRDFAQNEELQAEGLKEVVPALRGVLADEAARLGGRWERVLLAGISMGAATSVHVLFNLDVPRLGAFLGFSCRCPFAGRTLAGMRGVLGLEGMPAHDSVLRNTPLCCSSTASTIRWCWSRTGRASETPSEGLGPRWSGRSIPMGGIGSTRRGGWMTRWRSSPSTLLVQAVERPYLILLRHCPGQWIYHR